jgi:hypothetical protein
MKTAILAVATALLCGVCVWGVIALNSQNDPTRDAPDFSSMSSDAFYREIVVMRGTVEDLAWIDARVAVVSGEPTATVSTRATMADLQIGNGESFKKGDVLVKTGAGAVNATFDGRLEDVRAANGSLSLVLINYERFVIQGVLPQELLGVVRTGDPTRICFNGIEYEAAFRHVSALVDEDSLAPFVVDYVDPNLAVPWGASVTVRVRKQSVEEALFVPEYALLESGGQSHYVLVRDDPDGDAVSREVVVGIRGDGQAEIISGLEEGEIVLVDVATDLESGRADEGEARPPATSSPTAGG